MLRAGDSVQTVTPVKTPDQIFFAQRPQSPQTLYAVKHFSCHISVTLCTTVVPMRSSVISCQLRTTASVLPTSVTKPFINCHWTLLASLHKTPNKPQSFRKLLIAYPKLLTRFLSQLILSNRSEISEEIQF